MSPPERTELAPGLEISRMLTGMWQVADMERGGDAVDAQAAAQAMARYVERGFTTFDMADHYGSSEDIAGVYRDLNGGKDVQFLTKWVPEPGPISLADAREAVERSLRRTGQERLEVLQYHVWSFAHPGWLDGMFHLQTLREEGLIRHLAVTNFDTAHVRMLVHTGIDIVSNQVSYSLLDRRAGGDLAALCEMHGVKILAYGTLAGGFLSEAWLGAPEPEVDDLTTWSQMKYMRFIQAAGGWAPYQRLLQALAAVATKHGVSVANVACRWVLDQPGVAGIIVGARLGARDHMEENARVFDLRLSDDDRAAVAEAQDALDAVPGDCGDEYRRPPYLTASGDLTHHFEKMPAPYPTEAGGDGRTKALSGTIWEDLAGFSRAVRKGNRILVSGTTATHGARLVGGGDAGAQAEYCLDKIEGAIRSLGGRLQDVVRTRIYIRRDSDWEAVSRAHGRRFAGIQPANTLVQAGLIGDGYLVEMEAEAVVDA